MYTSITYEWQYTLCMAVYTGQKLRPWHLYRTALILLCFELHGAVLFCPCCHIQCCHSCFHERSNAKDFWIKHFLFLQSTNCLFTFCLSIYLLALCLRLSLYISLSLSWIRAYSFLLKAKLKYWPKKSPQCLCKIIWLYDYCDPAPGAPKNRWKKKKYWDCVA